VGRRQIQSIVHCTGGGASKVLNFAPNVKIVKNNYLPIPFLFDFIQKESQTDWKEMFQVFNMGTRLEVYVENESIAHDLISISQSFGIDAQVMGYVDGADIAEVQVHHNKNVYSYHK